jgi:uncharacterized protein (TIGR04255 family)
VEYDRTVTKVARVFPKLDLPPLREAVFDLFAVPAEDPSPDLASTFFGAYPEFVSEEEWHRIGLQMKLATKSGEVTPSGGSRMKGLRRWNADRSRAILFGPGVLAFNVLPPYGRFHEHLPRVSELLQRYMEIARPQSISYVGQRYINEIKVPADESPAEWFTVYPGLGGTDRHSPVAVQLEVGRFNPGTVILSLQLVKSESEGATYVLDIYAKADKPDPGDLERWHAEAHEMIDDAFFRSITKKARRALGERQPA